MALGLSVAEMVAFGFGLARLAAAGLGNGGELGFLSDVLAVAAVVTAVGCS